MLLSLSGTALSLQGLHQTAPWAVALGILAMAWAKARLILLHYLGLANVLQWRAGMMAAIGFAVALFAMLWMTGYLTAR